VIHQTRLATKSMWLADSTLTMKL
ncbi:uncharacterized protein METZ01_LOCUS238048, partial [marine metagenome]